MHCVKGANLTHAFCNYQAIKILYNDNYTKEANLFTFFSEELQAGNNWADKGFKSFYHFYNTETGSGKWRWPNATITCELYFTKAFELWEKGKYNRAMFYLGAATHLVQDMCVPHHARCVLMDGHNIFEAWAKEHRENYCAHNDGMYLKTKSTVEWVHSNASFSLNYFPYVQSSSSEADYHQATSVLLPRAQRSTSGFWLWFYKLISK